MNWEEAERGLQDIGNQFSMVLAKVLFDATQTLPDDATILEIGAFQGFSTCALAFACVGTSRYVFTIDTFIGNVKNTNLQDGVSYYETFKKNVADRGLSEYILALIGRSEAFYDWKQPLDLLFIDGDHTIMQQDFDAFYPYLKAGGILLMHDVSDDNAVWSAARKELTGVQLVQNLGWGHKRGANEGSSRAAL